MRVRELPFEPAGNHYLELLEFLGRWASFASLGVKTVRPPVDPMAYAGVLADLETFRVGDRLDDDGDGAVPPRSRVTFRYDADSIRLLQQIASCLFSWQMPYLPEDLTLYREDWSLLLGSIGHEYDSWLVLDDREHQELTAHFADLKQVSPPQVAFTAASITIAGGADTLLTLARHLREPPEPGLLLARRADGAEAFVEIRVESGITGQVDGNWIGIEGNRVVVSGDSVNLDILAEEISTLVAGACSAAKTRGRVLLVPYEGHPFLRADALALEVEVVHDRHQDVSRSPCRQNGL